MASNPEDEIEQSTLEFRRTAKVAPLVSSGCAIEVVDGPDKGKTFRIDDLVARRALVGQSPACDVVLTDPLVSRRHASIESDARGFRIKDLGSTNGTLLGRLVVFDALVPSGGEVTMGSTRLRFDRGTAENTVDASSETRFGRLLGASPQIRRVFGVLERLARSDVPVLIEGETGTGKEAAAESLHEMSGRTGPFVVFDCASVSPALIEAELFGHVRGAFTGADADRPGLFEEADQGTVLIDEIGDLDLALQAKLLRVLERGEVRRVGSNDALRTTARVIAATRRNLDEEIQARRFRDDLFFRLAVARVELPPLREREGDVKLLARCFWKLLGGPGDGPSPELIARLERYAWPGNVRELHNAIALEIAMGGLDLPESVPRKIGAPLGSRDKFFDELVHTGLPLARVKQEALLELERRYLEHMLSVHGTVGRAAAASGIGRRYFHKLKRKQETKKLG